MTNRAISRILGGLLLAVRPARPVSSSGMATSRAGPGMGWIRYGSGPERTPTPPTGIPRPLCARRHARAGEARCCWPTDARPAAPKRLLAPVRAPHARRARSSPPRPPSAARVRFVFTGVSQP